MLCFAKFRHSSNFWQLHSAAANDGARLPRRGEITRNTGGRDARSKRMSSAVVQLVRKTSARGLTLVGAVALCALAPRFLAPTRAAHAPIALAIVLDASDSMNGGDKLSRARAAADRAIDELGPGDRLAVVACSTRATLLVAPAAATDELRARAHAAIAALEADGGTNLSDGIALGARLVADAAGARRLVVISDGDPTEGLRDPRALAALAADVAASGTSIATIGVGDDPNAPLLAAIEHRSR